MSKESKESKEWLKFLKEEYNERELEMKQYNNTDLWVLKTLGKNIKGLSFRGKLKRIKENIRWAWQRAWRGYDDVSVFNYDLWFPDVTMQILKDFYVINHGSWCKPIDERKDEDDMWYEYEETQEKIKNMVMLLNMVNDLENEDAKIQKAQKEFLVLFSKHLNNLWW